MSKNILQVYTANPITTNQSTDLMYFGQSPYGLLNDAGMTFANFAAQFAPAGSGSVTSGSINQLAYYAANGTTVSGLATANNAGLLTNGTGVPSWVSYTGTGAPVLATSPTITTPRITRINDVNGNGALDLTGNASAVNYIALGNSAAGQPLNIGVTGTDANVEINFATKGTGPLVMFSQNTSYPIIFGTGSGYQHSTYFNFANTAATQTVTWQDATGTVAFLTDVAGQGKVNSGTANQLAYYASTGTTVGGLSSANSASLVTNSSGVPAWSSTMTNGQVIIGSTGATPTAATLTAGSNITITNAAGSITINSTAAASQDVTSFSLLTMGG